MSEWAGFVVNFVPPSFGLVHYLFLRRRIVDPRLRRLAFWCYFAYGGLLVVLLTALFWYWSGAASLGFAFLLLAATPGLPIAAIRLKPRLAPEPLKARFITFAQWFPLALALGVGLTAIFGGNV